MRDRILHLADLHLGDRHDYLGPKASARRTEADGVLERIVAWALRTDSRIGGVVIAGDLFDVHDPPHALVESILAQLTALTRAGIQLLTVPGNHDEYSYPDTVYRRYAARWPETLVTLPKQTRVATWDLGTGPIDLYAMAYVAGRSKPPYDEIARDPASPHRAICVLHGSLDAAWSDRSLPLRSERLARSGFDYVALGHIHKPMERKLGSGWIAYPGRIEGGSFDDPGGSPLLAIETGGPGLAPIRLTRPGSTVGDVTRDVTGDVPIESRHIETTTLDLSGLASVQELESRLEALARADGARILRVRLTGLAGFSLELASLHGRWAGWFFHLDLEDARAGAVASAGELDRWAETRTVRGGFIRRAQRELASAADDEQRLIAGAALRYGLAAFSVGSSAGEETSGEGEA